MSFRQLFKTRKVQALAKNADNDSDGVTFEVRSGFRDFVRGSKMYVIRALPGTPVECLVSFDQHRSTVVFLDGLAPVQGNTYVVMRVSSDFGEFE